MLPIEEIKTKLHGEVDTSEEALVKYSHDASVFEVRPTAVVHPKDLSDVQTIVKWAHENKSKYPELSLTARSAGTCMSGGSLTESLVLDFTTHINAIRKVEKTEVLHEGERGENAGFAVVEPGMFYRDFEKLTLAKNLLLPCYTASKSLNTVGGMVGNNSAGEKTLSYGQTKDFVEEIEVVLSNGETCVFKDLSESQLEEKMKLSTFEGKIYRELFHLVKENYDLIMAKKPITSKNSAGYLLWEVWDKKTFRPQRLITGSQGTLAFVTKIKFRLVQPKPKSKMLVMFLKDLKILGDLVDVVTKYKPETLESYDNHTFKLAVKFLPEMLKKMSRGAGSAFGGIAQLVKLGMQFLPEVWMVLTGGIPKLVVIAEFTGTDEKKIVENLLACKKAVDDTFHIPTHVTKNDEETQKYWTIRRESFSLLRQHVSGLSTAPFIDDIAVQPHNLPEFLPKLNAILDKYPSLIYTIAGHAGDGNFHIIPLMDLKKADQRAIIPKLSDEVYDLVLSYKGTTTAEHNDGLIRTPYLGKMFGSEMTHLFEQVKDIFDPLGIFNPRKKVHGDLNWAMEHIKKS